MSEDERSNLQRNLEPDIEPIAGEGWPPPADEPDTEPEEDWARDDIDPRSDSES